MVVKRPRPVALRWIRPARIGSRGGISRKTWSLARATSYLALSCRSIMPGGSTVQTRYASTCPTAKNIQIRFAHGSVIQSFATRSGVDPSTCGSTRRLATHRMVESHADLHSQLSKASGRAYHALQATALGAMVAPTPETNQRICSGSVSRACLITSDHVHSLKYTFFST